MKILSKKLYLYLLWCWASIGNIFRKNKITHVFYYSERQGHAFDDFYMFKMFNRARNPDVQFKGKPYTEMREFKYGFSNWSDAKIIGIGGYDDLTVGEQKVVLSKSKYD